MKDQEVSKAIQGLIKDQREGRVKPLSDSTQIRVPNVTPPKRAGSKKKQLKGQILSQASQQVTLPKAPSETEKLAPKRVQRLHLKAPQDALQTMVRLEESADKRLEKRRFKRSQESDQDLQASAQEELWRDMAKLKEERLFQIDRTIK